MTELRTLSKQLQDTWGIHMITNTQEFQTFYSTFQLSKLGIELLTANPEIQTYCEVEVISKILHSQNEYLAIVLSKSLSNIVAYLDKRQYKFNIDVYLSRDAYVKNWEGITIRIYVNYRNFTQQMKIWQDIEEIVTNVFDFVRNKYPADVSKINEANEIIATAVEKLEGQS
jgi:hypothetical protein